MDTDTPIPIPPSWLAALHEWAPYVVAALVATTVCVHTTLPIARLLKRKAATTAARWDDTAARRLVATLEAIEAVTRWCAAILPRLAVGGLAPADEEDAERRPHRDRRPEMRPPPSSGGAIALALVIVAAACATALSGCGGQSYRAHAQALLVTSGGVSIAGTVADEARAAALDAVEEQHPAHGPERTAALEAEAARWRPLGVALDAGRSALLVWSEALRVAHLAGTTDADLLVELAPVAGRVLLLYDRIVALLEEIDVVGAPALPAVVRSLATAIGGE